MYHEKIKQIKGREVDGGCHLGQSLVFVGLSISPLFIVMFC